MVHVSRASGFCIFIWNPSPGSRSGLVSVATGNLPTDFSRPWIEKRAFQDLNAAILSTFPAQTDEFKDSFTKSSLNYLPCYPHLHRGERWPCHWNSIDKLFLAAENMQKGPQMLLWSAILEHRTCFEEAASQGTQLKASKTTSQRKLLVQVAWLQCRNYCIAWMSVNNQVVVKNHDHIYNNWTKYLEDFIIYLIPKWEGHLN